MALVSSFESPDSESKADQVSHAVETINARPNYGPDGPPATTRNLGILDMANETLAMICSNLEPVPRPYVSSRWCPKNGHLWKSPNAEHIQNFRLVCRRFADAGARFLLPQVTVEVQSEESVKRLEAIAHHPTISNSVATVRVLLGYYDVLLVQDMEDFRWNRGQPWRDERIPHRYKNGFFKKWCFFFHVVSYDPVKHQKRVTQDDWARMMEIVSRAYSIYKLRWAEQQKLQRDGMAADRIAKAMARMPQARKLVLDDESDRWRPIDLPLDSTDDNMFQIMIQPEFVGAITRYEEDNAFLLRLPMDIIVALHRAGGSLISLHIDMSTSFSPPPTIFPSSGWKDVRAATRQLKQIRFFAQLPNADPERVPNGCWGHLEGMLPFVDAVLGGPDLETIWLDGLAGPDDWVLKFDLPRVLFGRKASRHRASQWSPRWPKLRELVVAPLRLNIQPNEDTLTAILKALPQYVLLQYIELGYFVEVEDAGGRQYVPLEDVPIPGGTLPEDTKLYRFPVSDLIDAFRNEHQRRWQLGVQTSQNSASTGRWFLREVEYDHEVVWLLESYKNNWRWRSKTLGHELSSRGTWEDWKPRKVEKYIWGLAEVNPIRAIEESGETSENAAQEEDGGESD